MIAAGIIEDSISGKELSGATISIVDAGGTVFKSIVSASDGYFSIDDDRLYPGSQYGLYVSLAGYEPVLIFPTQFDAGFRYELDRIYDNTKEQKINWPLIIGVAGLGLAVFSSGKNKKVSGINPTAEKILTNVVLIGGTYFLIAKPLLTKLGILDSQDTIDLDNESTNSLSPWNPNFWKTGGANTLILTNSAALNLIRQINGAIDIFNDDEAAIIAAFRSLRTQSQLSYLASLYTYDDKPSDLFQTMRDVLSDAELNSINKYIMTLPKYRL